MCRLFGFKSVLDSQVHRSLIQADNALADQSMKHPDGWGVAYYRENVPHLIKSTDRAFDDHIFHKVSGVVSSKTVLAHIRKATQGVHSLINSHPFQYGHWVFAHNGNLKGFDKYRSKLIEHVDSEVLFYLLLTQIKKCHPLSHPDVPAQVVTEATQKFLDILLSYTGDLYAGTTSKPTESHATFILTTGSTMFGFNGGQHIKYSTYKSTCPDRDDCPFFQENCEMKSQNSERINHLILSSEKHEGENIWTDLRPGEIVSVDDKMIYRKTMLSVKFITQLS